MMKTKTRQKKNGIEEPRIKIKKAHAVQSEFCLSIFFFRSAIHLLANLPTLCSYFERISIEKNIEVNMLL